MHDLLTDLARARFEGVGCRLYLSLCSLYDLWDVAFVFLAIRV